MGNHSSHALCTQDPLFLFSRLRNFIFVVLPLMLILQIPGGFIGPDAIVSLHVTYIPFSTYVASPPRGSFAR